MSQAFEKTTEYALEQRSRLKKVLRPRDLILFTTSGIIGIDTIATSASNGVQAIFWVVISCLLFAIPYAMIAAEMGSSYVKEGGLYVWIKEAFNPYISSILTFVYWVSNPLWMASLAVESVGVLQSMLHATWSISVQFIIALILIWLVALLEITYLNVGKWLPNIGAVIKVVLLLAVAILAIVAVTHLGHVANSFSISQFLPTKTVAIAYLPVLIYQWQGFELQSNAAQEMINPKRDVPLAILWSVILSAIGYTLGIVGLLLVLPLHTLSNVSGLFDAFKTMLPGSPALLLIGIFLVIGLLSGGTTWLLGVDRAFAASGYDGNIPRFFGHFHPRFGTPDRVAIAGAVLSSIMLAMNLYASSGNLGTVYQILLNMAVLAGTAPYLFMFPALLIFRKRYPNIKRPFQIPGGKFGTWLAIILGLVWIIGSMIAVFIPGSNIANKGLYELELVGGTVIALVVASILYFIGKRQQNQVVSVSLTDEFD